MLKMAQKTNITSEWVQKVMINEPSFGELAMKHCLIVGTQLLKDSAYGGNSKSDDVPDILNMCPKEFSEKENLFVNELNKYVKHNSPIGIL